MKNSNSINIAAAHLLAYALWKNLHATIADIKLNDDGFYIDLHLEGETISTKDFSKIEKMVQKISSGAHKVECVKAAKNTLESSFNSKYLQYQLKHLPTKDIDVIKFADYIGICEPIDIVNTNAIKYFKLLTVGGSYWLGDVQNEQLVRIGGLATDTKESFDTALALYNERLERDHRTIGKNLELFTFNSLAGQGMPIWLPKGTAIRKQIRDFLGELEFKYGFEPTYTPILGNVDLYKISGHWDHYKENMFPVMHMDTEDLVLRPMTCPHHILVFKRKPLSYKQLPMRLCEESTLHRYESSGGLTGFERVRGMVLEDTHIFCTPEQLEHEVMNCYNIVTDAHKGLNSQICQIDLSLHDPKDKAKYHHDEKMWAHAEGTLKSMLVKHNIPFVEKVGEAAFYGPKIDFQVRTVLGRTITMSTIQLDFLLPERFELTYKDADGSNKPAVMLHLGIIGTYERLLSILLEQTKGVLPLWLSPVQVMVIPVNTELHTAYALHVAEHLKGQFIRLETDLREERMSKKIRDAQMLKIPFQLILGDNEVKDKTVSYRIYGQEDSHTLKLEDFAKNLQNLIKNKT